MVMVFGSTVTSEDVRICCCGQPMEGYNISWTLGFLFLGKKLFQVQLHVIVFRRNL